MMKVTHAGDIEKGVRIQIIYEVKKNKYQRTEGTYFIFKKISPETFSNLNLVNPGSNLNHLLLKVLLFI